MPAKVYKAVEDEPVATEWRLVSPYPADLGTRSVEYFYDGEARIENGVVIIPKSKPHWAQRLLSMNFQWENGVAPEDFRIDY